MFHLKTQRSIITYKGIYTVLILAIYLIGKSIPLYMLDMDYYRTQSVSAERIWMQSITGDAYQCSLFALGISPYMIGTMIVQVISAFRGSQSNGRISPKKNYRMTLSFTLLFATVQAMIHVEGLRFQTAGEQLIVVQMIAVLEMITGTFVILWLSSRNKQYGIGGQSALIFINIIDGIFMMLNKHSFKNLILPILLSFVVIMVVVLMENAEMRIPVQRISIHNIYADKNYLAVKLNPIGVMPAMFSTACYMIPQLFVTVLGWFFPQHPWVVWWQENLILSKPVGIFVYCIVLYIITIAFSRVFLNPNEIMEQYLKSGDSLVNLHAGKETRQYLSRTINRISFLSATVMCICLTIPMLLSMNGLLESSLMMLPSSVMMLTGMWCNLYREVAAIKDFDAYKMLI